MRELTTKEIQNLASRKGVRRIAVENFLMSMGTNRQNAVLNAQMDANLYHWNSPTNKAILDGIQLAGRAKR